MVKYVKTNDPENPSGVNSVTTYSLDNPWWKVKGLDPDTINWGRPLILEYWYTISPDFRKDMYPPTFTIKPRARYYSHRELYNGENRIYPSFIQTYLEHADPTEYIFAMSVFNSWEIWEKIANSKSMQELITEARRQLDIRLKALSIRTNLMLAEAGSGPAVQWAIKGGWDVEKDIQKLTRGRKSKRQLEAEAKDQVDDIADAMHRVAPFLQVVSQ